jgi:hypothetical protein
MEVLRHGIDQPPLVHALISHVCNSEANALKLVFNSGTVVTLGFLSIALGFLSISLCFLSIAIGFLSIALGFLSIFR